MRCCVKSKKQGGRCMRGIVKIGVLLLVVVILIGLLIPSV